MRMVVLTLCVLVFACGTSTESSETRPVDMSPGDNMVGAPDAALHMDASLMTDVQTADAAVSTDMMVADAVLPDMTIVDAALPDMTVVDAALPDTTIVDAALPDTTRVDAMNLVPSMSHRIQ